MKYQGTSKELLEQLEPLTTQYWEARRLPHATAILLEAWETWKGEGKNYKIEFLPWYDRLCVITFIVGFFGGWVLAAIYAPWDMIKGDEPTFFGFIYLIGSLIFWVLICCVPSQKWRTKKQFYKLNHEVSATTRAKILGVDSDRWDVWDAINEKVGLEYLPYKRQAWDLDGLANTDYDDLIKQLRIGFESPVTVILDKADIEAINFARLLVSKSV